MFYGWFVLGIVCSMLLYRWVCQRRDYVRKVNKIPGPQTSSLLAKAFKFYCFSRYTHADIFLWVARHLPKKYGPVVRLWAAHYAHILLSKAQHIEQVMRVDNGMLPKSGTYHLLDLCIGESLIVTNGDRWHTYRKVMNPGFSFNVLHKFMPVFNKHALTMARNISKEKINSNGFDILHYTSVCALDIICETSMGVEIHAQINKDSSYVKSINSLMEYFLNRYMTPWHRSDFLFSLSVSRRTADKYLKYVHNFADKVIKERREYLNSVDQTDNTSNSQRGMALLDLLLAAEKEHPQYLTPDDIRHNVNTFIVAGYDTVATASAFILFLLATYPEIQDRVVEELVEVFGDSGRVPDVADLARLKYLERCIKESLRLYPSASFYERATKKDIQIDGYVIPAGCTITFNIYGLHRDPEIFPDPEKFDPDRFLPENCYGRHPYAFLPFSIGPRNCIGQKFAMLEEKTVVSTILRRYTIEALQHRNDIKLKAGIVLHPENGLKIRLYDRLSHPNLRVQE